MSQHPAAILRKAVAVNVEVVNILQDSLPPLLAPILQEEGINQVMKGCDMVKKFIEVEGGQLARIKLRFRADRRYVRKVLFNSDTVVAVLKTDDYNGRKGRTLFVCPDKGIVDKHNKVVCPIETLLPNEGVDAFDAALAAATDDLRAAAPPRRPAAGSRVGAARPAGGGGAMLRPFESDKKSKKKEKKNKEAPPQQAEPEDEGEMI